MTTVETPTLEMGITLVRRLPPPERARLVALVVAELVEPAEAEAAPSLKLTDLWQQVDADPADWRGERTASEELMASRR